MQTLKLELQMAPPPTTTRRKQQHSVDEPNRTEFLSLRLSKVEKSLIKRNATKQGQCMATYLMECVRLAQTIYAFREQAEQEKGAQYDKE